MAKKVIGFIKLHVPGGQANPAPPVGPALGQHGVNIMEFCKQFNARTQDKQGITTPVEITVFADRSFTFITKTPAGGRAHPQGDGHSEGLGRTRTATRSARSARRSSARSPRRRCRTSTPTTSTRPCGMIAGTARSMGVEVEA